MEQRVAGDNILPISQFAFLIKAHAELFVAVHGSHDNVQHYGEELESALSLPFYQMRDVEIRIERIFTLYPRIIIVEVNGSLPRAFVYHIKLGSGCVAQCLGRHPRNDTIDGMLLSPFRQFGIRAHTAFYHCLIVFNAHNLFGVGRFVLQA